MLRSFLFMIMVVPLALASCNRGPELPIKPELMAKVDTSAVLSLYCSKELAVLSPSADSVRSVRKKLTDAGDLNFTTIANDMRDRLFDDYQSILSLTFMDEEDVALSDRYARLNQFGINSRGYSLPSGYLVIPSSTLDKRDYEEIKKIFPASDAFCFGYMRFAVKPVGKSRAKVKAFFKIEVVNLEEEKVVNMKREVLSEKKMRLDGGEELVRQNLTRFCYQTAHTAMDEMEKFMKEAAL